MISDGPNDRRTDNCGRTGTCVFGYFRRCSVRDRSLILHMHPSVCQSVVPRLVLRSYTQCDGRTDGRTPGGRNRGSIMSVCRSVPIRHTDARRGRDARPGALSDEHRSHLRAPIYRVIIIFCELSVLRSFLSCTRSVGCLSLASLPHRRKRTVRKPQQACVHRPPPSVHRRRIYPSSMCMLYDGCKNRRNPWLRTHARRRVVGTDGQTEQPPTARRYPTVH